MKTVTIKLYNFDELSDDAKEKARDWWRSGDDVFPWAYEFSGSVKAIENALDVSFFDISVGSYRPYWYDENDDNDAENMCFCRAVAYINNRFDFKKIPWTYPTKKPFVVGRDVPLKPVGVALAKNVYDDNLPTGYCSDYVTHESYKKFIEYGRKHKSAKLSDFFDILACGLRDEIESEYDFMQSDEYIDDILSNNDYYFTVDGEFYK